MKLLLPLLLIISASTFSGCEIANTMFQIDSDSRSPTFGVNLMPSGKWFKRDISYHPKKLEYPTTSKTGPIEVIDLAPPTKKTNNNFQTEKPNPQSTTPQPLTQTPVPNKIPVTVILPESKIQQAVASPESVPLFD